MHKYCYSYPIINFGIFRHFTGIVENPISNEQHVLNCQTLIDSVASDILSVDLTHITGSSIVEGDKISIRNLLEIFAGLLEFFMECDDDDGW